MNIRPLRDNIVVKRIESEEKSKGGIVFLEQSKEKPNKGEVIAVGKGKVLEDGKVIPVDVKVGDMILFGKYSGQTFNNSEGDELLVLKESEIMGVFEE